MKRQLRTASNWVSSGAQHAGPPKLGMNMSQRARRIGKLWAFLAVALTLLHSLLFAGWILIGIDALYPLTPIVIVAVIYVALFIAIVAIFCQHLSRAVDPVAYREAREYGLSAMANVLKIERTRWRVRRSYNFRLQLRPQRFEYQMRVRVIREGAAEYEAGLAEYLSGHDVPKRGDVIAVKVHPLHPDVVVMSRDVWSNPSHH